MFDGHREDLRLDDLVRSSLIGRHLHRAVAELGITSVNELSKLNSQHTSGHELLVSELLESRSYFTTVRFRLWLLSLYYASYGSVAHAPVLDAGVLSKHCLPFLDK